MRGNLRPCRAPTWYDRSIPACAGEPPPCRVNDTAVKVYPRVCGGTRGTSCRRLAWYGLSPRVRGNPYSVWRPQSMDRSIPACAGEPDAFKTILGPDEVYPRVCGGTHAMLPVLLPSRGLSPRVRGNLDFSQKSACGGGLSPRVRGNRRRLYVAIPVNRSIPACAGEPVWGLFVGLVLGVYPRVCGGTRIHRRALVVA